MQILAHKDIVNTPQIRKTQKDERKKVEKGGRKRVLFMTKRYKMVAS